jgi:opacity protein-like surface antigen
LGRRIFISTAAISTLSSTALGYHVRFLISLFFCYLAAASKALGADPREAPPIVDRTSTDLAVTGPDKERTIAEYDWTGPYVGAHVGYAWVSSNWTAHETGATGPSLTGSLDFYKGFDFSKGSGRFFGGLQACYNYMLPSQLVLGVEGDVSFPNFIGATQTFSSASVGQASYGELVEYSGTVRVRLGYSFNRWLVYGTSGFAWTRDQFTRHKLLAHLSAAPRLQAQPNRRFGGEPVGRLEPASRFRLRRTGQRSSNIYSPTSERPE